MARWMLSFGHVLGAGGQDRGAQARVHGGIGQAHLGRDRDLAGELGEKLRALRVHRPFRCMMFLNWECPAMGVSVRKAVAARSRERRRATNDTMPGL
jgi:hypothetical protein